MKTTNHSTEELERMLRSRFGAENHFAVPEGYFDTLAERTMSAIRRRRHRRLAWRWAAAAVLTGAVVAGGVLFEMKHSQQMAEAESIQYIEDALDYSMIDNLSIASYLTEAE